MSDVAARMRHLTKSINIKIMDNTYKIIVSTIIFNKDKQVLLGKRSANEEVFPSLWGIPGGKVEFDTDSKNVLEDNLIREVKEEMGIIIEPSKCFKSYFNGEGTKLYIIFISDFISGQPEALEDTEDVKWWNTSDLTEKDLTPNTYNNILEASKEL